MFYTQFTMKGNKLKLYTINEATFTTIMTFKLGHMKILLCSTISLVGGGNLKVV